MIEHLNPYGMVHAVDRQAIPYTISTLACRIFV
jgi:hypothetical protein